MARSDWAQGNTQELPASQVFKDYVSDVGLTKQGPTKNPWLAGYDNLPPEIANSPVRYYVYNVSPIPRWLCMGGLGTKYLKACKHNEFFAANPLKVKEYEIDWADLGEYKHKAV